MSFEAMAWAVKQSCPTTGQKMVLLMIANYANDEGVCWPKKQTLADACCMSKAAVCTNIKHLTEAGMITVEERGGEPGEGRQRSSLIHLHMGPKSGQQAAEVSSSKTAGVQNLDPSGVQNLDSYKNLSKNNLSTEPITPSASAEEADFEEFWAAYPRRPNNPKQPAKAKYLHARRRLHASRETLLLAVRSYAASRVGQDPTYTAMAATWLNQRRWEEFAEPSKPTQAAPVSDGGIPDEAIITVHKGGPAAKRGYPGPIGNIAEVRAVILQQGADAELADMATAVEMFALLVQFERGEGFERHIPPFAEFVRWRWQSMLREYEFCYRGMNNKKSVRPKKVKP
jgi:hypothetical protein